MVGRGGEMVSSGGSPVQGLEHATVHQTLHGLLLWDRSEMGILFGSPSSGSGQRGERAVVTSFTIPRPTVGGSFGGSPA
jgi:hypothetical protein